jgi:serine/threonine protein kinase
MYLCSRLFLVVQFLLRVSLISHVCPCMISNGYNSLRFVRYALYGEISPKVDVFSFGVVLYEMISGRVAIFQGDLSTSSPQSGSSQGRTLTSLFEQVVRDPNGKEKLPGLLDPALKDDYPLDAVWKVAQLAEHCTRANAKNRPTMRFVVVQLMTLADTITQGWEMSSFPQDSMSTDSGILSSERYIS